MAACFFKPCGSSYCSIRVLQIYNGNGTPVHETFMDQKQIITEQDVIINNTRASGNA